uniref:Transmembrane protein 230 n=1 Tax=Plectus sambesii TaxID=2011161 RepID=A0A914X465_9BILA
MSQEQPRFDPNDPKYICCCGCHVMTGTKILASLPTICTCIYTTAFIIAIALRSAADPADGKWYDELLISMGISLIIVIPVLGCLWYGLIKEREGFLIPTLVCSVG